MLKCALSRLSEEGLEITMMTHKWLILSMCFFFFYRFLFYEVCTKVCSSNVWHCLHRQGSLVSWSRNENHCNCSSCEDSFFCFHPVNNRPFCQEELSNPQHWFLILLNCVPACSTPSLWRIYNHILVTIKNCPIFLKTQKHFRPCELLQQISHMSIPPLWRSKDRSWSWNLANSYQTSLKCMR